MMKCTKKNLLVALVAISILAITIPALAITGIYNKAAVNLRSSPGGGSYGLVSKGTTCDILAEKTVRGVPWYKVKITSHTLNSPDLYNRIGWSQVRYITASGSGGSTPNPGTGNDVLVPANPGVGRTALVATSNTSLTLRKRPNGQSIGTLPKSSSLTYYRSTQQSESGNVWMYVVQGNKRGWVAAQYLRHGNDFYVAPSECVYCGGQPVKTSSSSTVIKSIHSVHYNPSQHICDYQTIRTTNIYNCGHNSAHPSQKMFEEGSWWKCGVGD